MPSFACCLTFGSATIHAKYSILTPTELHMYWAGKHGLWIFEPLSESVRLFGKTAFALRGPLLLLFALALLRVFYLLQRAMRRASSTKMALGTLAFLLIFGVQQAYSLRAARVQRHAMLDLRDHLERSAAPGEIVLVEDRNLLMALDWYASPNLASQLRTPDAPQDTTEPPTKELGRGDGELVYIGPLSTARKRFLNITLIPDTSAPRDIFAKLAPAYCSAETGGYFISPASPSATAAVSSRS